MEKKSILITPPNRSHDFPEAKGKPITGNFLPIQEFGCVENS